MLTPAELANMVSAFINQKDYSPLAKNVLGLSTIRFLICVGFASANNHALQWEIISFHAIWHIIAGFGFLILW